MLTRRQLHLEFLDEGSHILVTDNCALPFLYAEDAFRYFHLHVALHLCLTSQTPVVLYLLTGEVWTLRVKYFAAARENLQLTLSAACLTATGRRQEDAVLVEGSHYAAALIYCKFCVAVDSQCHLSAWRKIFLCHKKDNDQDEYYN